MQKERFDELAGEISAERSITLPTTAEAVWEHLTDGDLVGDWMEGDVRIDPRPGGTITMASEGGPTVWGTVEEVIPGRRLQWSWRTDDGLPTMVEIDLEPVEDGTVLTVKETLLPWRITGLSPRLIGPTYPSAFLSAAA